MLTAVKIGMKKELSHAIIMPKYQTFLEPRGLDALFRSSGVPSEAYHGIEFIGYACTSNWLADHATAKYM
jgi:hypothetical protein